MSKADGSSILWGELMKVDFIWSKPNFLTFFIAFGIPYYSINVNTLSSFAAVGSPHFVFFAIRFFNFSSFFWSSENF